MRLVLGIGNPGAAYAETRHNVGFKVLNEVATRRGWAFRKASPLALEAGREDVGWLVKPLTYVNRSGAALAEWSRFEPGPEELLVVVDDVNLELGRLRLKARGSHGGHNGLKDIERVWGSNGYPRLRVGVGATADRGVDLVSHVLGPFEPDELETVSAAIDRAADAVLEFLEGRPVEQLMGTYNRQVSDA